MSEFLNKYQNIGIKTILSEINIDDNTQKNDLIKALSESNNVGNIYIILNKKPGSEYFTEILIYNPLSETTQKLSIFKDTIGQEKLVEGQQTIINWFEDNDNKISSAISWFEVWRTNANNTLNEMQAKLNEMQNKISQLEEVAAAPMFNDLINPEDITTDIVKEEIDKYYENKYQS